jgi:hypothetical protein
MDRVWCKSHALSPLRANPHPERASHSAARMDDSIDFVVDLESETGRSAVVERTGWEEVIFELEDDDVLLGF